MPAFFKLSPDHPEGITAFGYPRKRIFLNNGRDLWLRYRAGVAERVKGVMPIMFPPASYFVGDLAGGSIELRMVAKTPDRSA